MPDRDIIREQDEAIAHRREFILWPSKWEGFDRTKVYGWQWHKLDASERPNIPDEPGIYTLLIQPGIAGHPLCSYLMYVGQAVSLRTRFADYLTRERRESGRPKIFRLLNKYSNYIWFCFTIVPEETLDDVEDSLMNAYIPPCNDQLPIEIRPVRGAF